MWFGILGYGIEAARVEGVTTTNTFQAEECSSNRSVADDGVAHVDGAGGVEAASRGEQRAEEALVDIEQKNEERAHEGVDTLFALLRRSM